MRRETGIEPNFSIGGKRSIVEWLHTLITHSVQGALNFLCAVLGLLTCLLRTELVHLLEVTHRIKGIILRIAQPLHDFFDILLSGFARVA